MAEPPTRRAGAPAASTDPAPTASTPKLPTVGELRRERKRLWDEREQAVYHVGGLAVDLRRRGLDDLGLINRRADAVLAIDTRINEVDEVLTQVDARRHGAAPLPAAGYCMSCGAPFQVEAAFCFRCGARVVHPEPETPAPVALDEPTAVIDPSGAPT